MSKNIKIWLKEACSKHVNDDNNNQTQHSECARNRVLEHRARLFQGQSRQPQRRAQQTKWRQTTSTSFTNNSKNSRRGIRAPGPGRDAVRGRSWTVNLFCLANKHTSMVPSSLHKIKLQKAGLALKFTAVLGRR